MNNIFFEDEKVYRAVYPPEFMQMFWKKDGTLSSAAFADRNGLSVERGNYREDSDVIKSMKERFSGCIVSLLVSECVKINAILKYLPSKKSIYHSEIHGSTERKLLTKRQRLHLAKKAVVLIS